MCAVADLAALGQRRLIIDLFADRAVGHSTFFILISARLV
jgi:hypothetical protein